jgi:nucleotide-binding universal stress UspA family protein
MDEHAQPLQRVLVALDGSEISHGALLLAIELSHQYKCELILCTVVDHDAAIVAAQSPDGPFMGLENIVEHYETAAKLLLTEAAARTAAAGAPTTTMLLDGRPAVSVADYAKEAGVDAIVMGTHGKRGLERMFLGSTAEGVLHMTTLPTFVVRQASDPNLTPPALPTVPEFGRILVAVDDSDPSDAAFAFALDLAAVNQSLLLCCNAIEQGQFFDKAAAYGYNPKPLLESLHDHATELVAAKAEAAKKRGLTLTGVIVEGNAPDAILRAAAEHTADLIVVGTHGRRGLQRLFMGSVAESILRRSVLPVAVVRGVRTHHRAAAPAK